MKNKLAQVIRRILPDTTDRQDGPESFEIRFDADGVKLYLEKVEFERFLSGAGGPNINLQGVVLMDSVSMLVLLPLWIMSRQTSLDSRLVFLVSSRFPLMGTPTARPSL